MVNTQKPKDNEEKRENMSPSGTSTKRGFYGLQAIAQLPRCGAKARSTGKPCQRCAEHNVRTGILGRCYLHGSRCTGPRTAEGKARCAAAASEAHRGKALTHGMCTQTYQEAKAALHERLESIKAKADEVSE